MTVRKQAKCTVCGQTIQTLAGAYVSTAPVVCRRCFGHQTYNVPKERTIKTANITDSVEDGS